MSTSSWPDHLLSLAEWDTLAAYTLVDGDYKIAAEGTADLVLLAPSEVRIRVQGLTSRRQATSALPAPGHLCAVDQRRAAPKSSRVVAPCA